MSNPLGSCSSRRFELQRFPDEQSLADSAAERWLRELGKSGSSDYFVALSGGRIARLFFESIASTSRRFPQSLDRVHFFWADERCVPPDDPESNFRVANDHMFLPLKLRSHRLHRIRGEINEAQAVSEAEADIGQIVPRSQNGQPILDLVFLGMGEDGHVASLFPNEPEDRMRSSAVYRTVVATKPPPIRITLGYGAIAAARQVWILAAGTNKEGALWNSLAPDGVTPLAKVVKLRQETLIFTDIRLPEMELF